MSKFAKFLNFNRVGKLPAEVNFKRTLRIFCPVEFDLHTSHSPGHTQPIEKATRSTRTHKSNPPNSLSPISRKLKLQIAQLFFQVLRAVMKKRGGSSRGRLDEVSTRSKDSSTFFSFSLAQRKICFCHPPLPPATDSHGLRFTDRIEQLPTLYLFLLTKSNLYLPEALIFLLRHLEYISSVLPTCPIHWTHSPIERS